MAHNELTPMMRQFTELKQKHPDAILLFRCGDFYETYMQDAVDASRILGITLTRRSKNTAQGEATEMAGFPYHALDTYLPKLIRAGRRVAICDQLEDPKLTKKLVKRGITELVTPGVALTDNVLNYKENNFLAAVHMATGQLIGVSFLDISTGEFLVGEGMPADIEKLLVNFAPKEVLFERGKRGEFERLFGTKFFTFELDDWAFGEQAATQKLLKHFDVTSLKGFGISHMRQGVVAAGAALQYLELTQHNNLKHISSLARIDEGRHVRLDKFTVRSLELTDPMQEGGQSLLNVIDRTVSPMGARALRRWLLFPLNNEEAINNRLDVVDYFFRNTRLRDLIDEQMCLVGDLERTISRVSLGRILPRELITLKTALLALVPVKAECEAADDKTVRRIGQGIDICEELRQSIERTIEPDPPHNLNKGGVIRQGVCDELDELRQIAFSGKDYLLALCQREQQATGIQSLKIGYNNVFGYFLEVRNTFKDRVPDTWIRKQTLASAERYVTEELKEYEQKILGAEDRIQTIENRMYNDFVASMQDFVAPIQNNAALIAELDCLLSFAKTSAEHNYIRPVIDGQETVIDIKQGRHPVIETQLPAGERYVPNDIMLDSKRQQIMMITGPNMAGKSALLRQTALITLLAQVGCFVPAESAKIGLVDKIFTRVGASDNISLGESTFMVEMTEAANILNNVTPRSLVLFDELGRGTSTYDGISIAWAIVEHLHEHPKAQARTLFATHYHELNEMEKTYSRIKNYNVSVAERQGKVIFMRKLERGGSEHSFGIHVAQIAGMPKSIVKRASQVLRDLEAQGGDSPIGKPSVENIGQNRNGMQLSFFQLDDPVLCQIRDEILDLNINGLTPIDALYKLNDI